MRLDLAWQRWQVTRPPSAVSVCSKCKVCEFMVYTCCRGSRGGKFFLSARPLVQASFLSDLKRYLDALIPESASLRNRMVASFGIISGTLKCFLCFIFIDIDRHGANSCSCVLATIERQKRCH